MAHVAVEGWDVVMYREALKANVVEQSAMTKSSNPAPHPEAQQDLPKGKSADRDSPASRWEKIVIQMNQNTNSFERMPGSGTDHDGMQVWGSLGAAELNPVTKNLLVYMATGDRSARAVVWSSIFMQAMQWRQQEGWASRVPGVVDRMALYAIYHVADPHQFNKISHREWAKMLGLACGKDYKKYWLPRYNRILEALTIMAQEGIDAVIKMNARQ